jgi:prevent-host-death family protein
MTLLPSRGSASIWPTRDLSYFAEQRVGVERRLPAHYVLVNLVNPWTAGGAAMTDTVNLYDAKTNLSKLVDRAAAGEEIVIAKAGKPKAKLVPYRPPRKKRRGGQNLLGITYIAEDFDAPLPPEIQKYFE